MFGWLKNLGKGVNHTVVSTLAINCWKQCVAKETSATGPQYGRIEFWQEVMIQFASDWSRVHPAATDLIEDRCAEYLRFMEQQVLKNAGAEYTSIELEQIGEFIAVSIVRDFKEAILADAERASLVIDLLPRGWCAAAGLDPEKFDDWYLKTTGKPRIRRR